MRGLANVYRLECPSRSPVRPRFCLGDLNGRVNELSGATLLSLAFTLVSEAQQRGELAAWVAARESAFFPLDAAARGIDLSLLPVIFAPDVAAALRSADKLARSGAFRLLVLDLAGPRAETPRGRPPRAVPPALLSRLVGLARQHDTAVLVLTTSAVPPLGSLVSLRCASERQEAGPGRFLCVARALKDKRSGPGWTWSEVQYGPVGLR
jgi:recombination protein RecA